MNSSTLLEISPLVDCRGLQCPAPILRLADAARKHRGSAATLTVLATDADFRVDLEAWCRTTKSSLVRVDHDDHGVLRALVRLGAAPATSERGDTVPVRPRPSLVPPERDAAEHRHAGVLELAGMSAVAALRKVNEMSVGAPGQTFTVRSDAPGFDARLTAWATATDATLESIRHEGDRSIAVLRFAGEAADAGATHKTQHAFKQSARQTRESEAPPSPPSPPSQILPPGPRIISFSMVDPGAAAPAPRENRATLLVLHNDLEALLAALMVASASAAQGMQVEMFFAFWGIHLLRGEKKRPHGPRERPGLLQRMMLWMVPKGPSRQKLGRLHMGGIGTRILLALMRKRNILALDEQVQAAAKQGVKFRVCSMSMGLMGLGQRDIVDLPNVDFAGVTTFSERASRSAVSLVF